MNQDTNEQPAHPLPPLGTTKACPNCLSFDTRYALVGIPCELCDNRSLGATLEDATASSQRHHAEKHGWPQTAELTKNCPHCPAKTMGLTEMQALQLMGDHIVKEHVEPLPGNNAHE